MATITAYFFKTDYNPAHVIQLIEKARELNHEVRFWINEDTNILLVVHKDPLDGEDGGYELYQWLTQNRVPYDGLGIPSWGEWEEYGVDIPPEWALQKAGSIVVAVAPKDSHVLLLGALTGSRQLAIRELLEAGIVTEPIKNTWYKRPWPNSIWSEFYTKEN